MSAAPKSKLVPAEYLAIERRARFKSEYFNGEMFAMAGASYEHNRAKDNLAAALNTAVQGGPCFALTSDMRVKISATGLYTYPDIVVVCGEPAFEDDTHDTLLNPQVIVEVLSDSTEGYDRGATFRHYQLIPEFQEYILVSQDEPLCERFVRQPDDSWLLTKVSNLDGELRFATIQFRIKLSAVFAGVDFPETPGRGPRWGTG
jgi:Uma2 family endonuclease